MADDGAALFRELCVDLGFCSLSIEGQDRVLAEIAKGEDQATRAVFTEEGLDYDTDEREGLKAAVHACILRHVGDLK